MDKREHRQGARIGQGIKNGEVTKGEASRLRKQQRGIRRTEERAEADGVVTKGEKVRIERRQDKASRTIHRAKHNERDRNQNSGGDAPDVDPIESGESAAPDLPAASDSL